MGAIRACEMKHMGMRGYGEVYEGFCRDAEFRDDEVALAHGADAPYVALSEPLIHIRRWLDELVKTRLLKASQQRRLLDELMSMWYGDRTLSLAREITRPFPFSERTTVEIGQGARPMRRIISTIRGSDLKLSNGGSIFR